MFRNGNTTFGGPRSVFAAPFRHTAGSHPCPSRLPCTDAALSPVQRRSGAASDQLTLGKGLNGQESGVRVLNKPGPPFGMSRVFSSALRLGLTFHSTSCVEGPNSPFEHPWLQMSEGVPLFHPDSLIPMGGTVANKELVHLLLWKSRNTPGQLVMRFSLETHIL